MLTTRVACMNLLALEDPASGLEGEEDRQNLHQTWGIYSQAKLGQGLPLQISLHMVEE